MNWDQIDGKWKRFTGSMWQRRADSPTTQDQPAGQIQERHQAAKAETQKRADRWSRALKKSQR